VPVHGDTTDELDETFSLNLSNPINGYIADGQGIATIFNEDPPPQEVGPIIRLTRAYRVTRGYALPLRLSCTAAATGRCRGTVTAAGRGGRLGSRKFSISAGGRGTVKLRLSRSARSVLARHKPLRARVRASARDSAGRTGRATRTVTLRRPRGGPRFTG
jgi:hypothetical protein